MLSKKSLELSSPVEPVITEAGPAEPNGQTSSHDVRKDGDAEDDVALVDTPADNSSLPYQPASLENGDAAAAKAAARIPTFRIPGMAIGELDGRLFDSA